MLYNASFHVNQSVAIVLHLTTYKALLAAVAFQKRSQCVQLREKRQVLRREKDDERLPGEWQSE
jgi:hypothetical protein